MASYRKYIMMGMGTIMLPLAKVVLKEIVNKATKRLQESNSHDGENARVLPSSQRLQKEKEDENEWKRI